MRILTVTERLMISMILMINYDNIIEYINPTIFVGFFLDNKKHR